MKRRRNFLKLLHKILDIIIHFILLFSRTLTQFSTWHKKNKDRESDRKIKVSAVLSYYYDCCNKFSWSFLFFIFSRWKELKIYARMEEKVFCSFFFLHLSFSLSLKSGTILWWLTPHFFFNSSTGGKKFLTIIFNRYVVEKSVWKYCTNGNMLLANKSKYYYLTILSFSFSFKRDKIYFHDHKFKKYIREKKFPPLIFIASVLREKRERKQVEGKESEIYHNRETCCCIYTIIPLSTYVTCVFLSLAISRNRDIANAFFLTSPPSPKKGNNITFITTTPFIATYIKEVYWILHDDK